MLPKEIQDLLNLIPVEYQVVVRPVFLFYEGKIEKLEAQIKELQDQISNGESGQLDSFKPF